MQKLAELMLSLTCFICLPVIYLICGYIMVTVFWNFTFLKSWQGYLNGQIPLIICLMFNVLGLVGFVVPLAGFMIAGSVMQWINKFLQGGNK